MIKLPFSSINGGGTMDVSWGDIHKYESVAGNMYHVTLTDGRQGIVTDTNFLRKIKWNSQR